MNPLPTLLAAALASIFLSASADAAALSAPELVARLNAQRSSHGLDLDHGFVVSRVHPGGPDMTVVRVQHTYKGVPVFGSESVLLTNAAGQVLDETTADRRAGLGKGSANTLGPATSSFPVKPRVAAPAAIAALKLPAAMLRAAVVQPSASLIIYPTVQTVRAAGAENKPEDQLNALDEEERVAGYQLAWYVQLRLNDGFRPAYVDAIVSADDGHVIAQWDALQSADGLGHSEYSGDVALSTSGSGQQFRMLDTRRGTGGQFGGMAITNANHGTRAGSIYTDADNTWGDGQQYVSGGSTTDANGQTAAVDAMWGLANTYDMLHRTQNWQSLDGHNTATYIAAHVNKDYDNAYYDDGCKCMYIGDGSMFRTLASIDIIGHEMSHGVTASTSGLLYFMEPGGLNESNSDIGGEVVEAYAHAGAGGSSVPLTGNDWMMGKDISRTGTPLRWMYKPSLDGHSPDAWNSKLKRLDVHYASGPNNRMFYFLAQGSNAAPDSDTFSKYLTARPAAMTGIGLDKAYRIWFRAATTRFTLITNYADARRKMLATARELYGANSKEAKAVQRAYAAINVGQDIDE